MEKKHVTSEEIKKEMNDLGISDLTQEQETEFDKMVEQAEKDIEEYKEFKKSINVNFRWSGAELERCKKIAEKKGLPYQIYIKSILKQAMDKDEAA